MEKFKYNWDIARGNMKKIRKKHNMSQLKLQLEIGWCFNTIANYENGVNYPSINFVICFCEYFGISIDDLFRKDLVED